MWYFLRSETVFRFIIYKTAQSKQLKDNHLTENWIKDYQTQSWDQRHRTAYILLCITMKTQIQFCNTHTLIATNMHQINLPHYTPKVKHNATCFNQTILNNTELFCEVVQLIMQHLDLKCLPLTGWHRDEMPNWTLHSKAKIQSLWNPKTSSKRVPRMKNMTNMNVPIRCSSLSQNKSTQ